MLESIRQSPKTYITLLLIFAIGFVFAIGSTLYLLVTGVHEVILYGVIAGCLLGILFILIIYVIVQVLLLETEIDWNKRMDKLVANKKYEIILKKLEKREELTPEEFRAIADIEIIETKKVGEQP